MIAGDLALKKRRRLSRGEWARMLGVGVLFIAALVSVFAFQSGQEPVRLESGQVSPKTILAPERVTFVSQVQTDDARAKTEAAVKQVYTPPDANLARDRVRVASRVFDYIDSVRHDPYSEGDRKLEWVQAIPTATLPTLTLSRTLGMDEGVYHRVVSETLYVLDVTMREEIRPSDVSAEYAKVPSRVSLALPADQADLVTQWSKVFIVPNTFPDPVRTEEQRQLARSRVGTVYRTVEQGEAIVREGEVVTPLVIEALEAVGVMRPGPGLADFAGPALFALLLTVILAAYLVKLRPSIFRYGRTLLLLAFLVLLFTAGAKAVGGDRTLLPYLFPVSAAAMLLAVLIDTEVALSATMVLSLAFAFFSHNSFEFATYALAGGVVASLSLGRIERLQAFLWCGLYVALTNAAVVAIFRVTAHDTDVTTWGQMLIAAIGNGAFAGLIAFGSLFVLGKLFGITTSLELLDLARPTHPLLQKLLIDAPGTYHHSLIVSQLAEQAAQRIGADALLVRVAAYYHDVGKTADPQSFIENQLDGVNLHDTLEPKESAAIVLGHVARGVTLAKKYGVPERLREFIPQHHGTTLAAYFHRKAIKANGSYAPIEERDFRYPGPKPQSREAAILMLADGVEATTRAERPTSPEQIRVIVERIIDERLRDGQLDECDLTLYDLSQIRESFFGVLQGLFHPRVKYPEAPVRPWNPVISEQ
ncbi:MAG: HDIG domain-containing protein [Chloroflexota bacterium]|nr:HDIG domain-containing protein [Chloroflexota bacterium]